MFKVLVEHVVTALKHEMRLMSYVIIMMQLNASFYSKIHRVYLHVKYAYLTQKKK